MFEESASSELIFFVNGKKIVERNPDPEWTLLYYLRNKLLLRGTKLGCAEGGCGACTVMISKYDRNLKKVHHIAINGCLAPVCAMHGLAITTVEGIGSTKTKLHPVQERISKAHGSQCGFCTPGIVMSMYTLLRNQPKPSIKDLEVTFQGNLCRCTGYRPIIDGYKTFTEEWEVMQNGNAFMNGKGSCGMGYKCCKLQKNGTIEETDEVLFKPHEFAPYDPSQEPIFPSELKLYDTLDNQNLIFKGKEVTWYRPIGLSDLLDLKDKHPEAKIIVGNTEVGIETKFKHFFYPTRIQPTLIPEMTNIAVLENGVKFGAATSLHNMELALRKQIASLPEYKTRIFSSIVDMLNWFAGKQVRNVAAIGGNIMTGSPISDLNQILIASKVELELQSKTDGCRRIKMDETFFTSYRENIVRKNEILISITIPHTEQNQYFYAYKQARRRDDDTAIVNSAINVTFENRSNIIKSISTAFGGMAPTTVTTPTTSSRLIGKPWNQETLDLACGYLMEDLPLPPEAPGGVVQFRRALTLSFFFKAFLSISKQLQKYVPDVDLEKRDISATRGFESHPPKSSQYFEVLPTEEKFNTISKPVMHASAFKHATGEAVYCDDMPPMVNELYMGFVLSTKSHAKILSVDPSEALAMENVHAFFSSKDIPEERNKIGITNDEVIFASKVVTSQGQIIGIVIADDQSTAQKAARKVKVAYEDLQPIITIEDAIKHKSYFTEFKNPLVISSGNVDETFKIAPHIVEGECRSGAQEHFYLETQSCLVVPKNEDNEMEVFCSTQHPTAVGKLISGVLGIPQNRIVTRVKRIGGGFGGKEHRSAIVAIPAALAASRLNRPIRCMLDRDEDIIMTGGRHPFYMKYKTAFDDDGRILGCEIYLYNNSGYSNDLSQMVMERAVFHFQNAYNIPNVRVVGYVCKTNLPSNMAMRGFGAPQGMLAGEFMIRKVAEYLNKDVIDISRLNLYKEGDVTHYNQKLKYSTVRRCWDECIVSSNIHARQKEVDAYNRENRWKKRGISIVPTNYGVCFGPAHLNQAGALVHVYTDGSVLLSHGGAEMGQGLHTKMLQVASRILEIPLSKIFISETSTDKVPNTSPTAGSFSSDLNGMAVMYACEAIKQRLEPYKKASPNGKWEEWVSAAHFDRVSLSATGFYKSPFEGYDWEKFGNGELVDVYLYYTCGAACTEVEIDCLTGDHQVLRTDIVMDVGESLNPAIDVGQIEGAFMQGYGMYMLEEILYAPDGTIRSRGPGAYKLPGFASIPPEFNVSLLKGAPNPRAIYSSKAIGEPPLFLASSVLFAVREAVKAARADAGLSVTDFKLFAPVSCVKIRMACQDHLTAKLGKAADENVVPWNIVP